MKKLLTIIAAVSVLALVGCAGVDLKESSICSGVTPEESLICQKIPNPEMVSSALLAANYGAIKADAYSKDAALKVIDELEAVVDAGGISYMYVIAKVSELLAADEAAAVLIILSPNISLLESPITITPFDQKLLKAHLTYQRQIVSIIQVN